MKYELWQSKGDSSLTMLPENYRWKKAILEDDAALLKVFEAPTWEDAQRQKHEFLGWEPYKPFPADEETK